MSQLPPKEKAPGVRLGLSFAKELPCLVDMPIRAESCHPRIVDPGIARSAIATLFLIKPVMEPLGPQAEVRRQHSFNASTSDRANNNLCALVKLNSVAARRIRAGKRNAASRIDQRAVKLNAQAATKRRDTRQMA